VYPYNLFPHSALWFSRGSPPAPNDGDLVFPSPQYLLDPLKSIKGVLIFLPSPSIRFLWGNSQVTSCVISEPSIPSVPPEVFLSRKTVSLFPFDLLVDNRGYSNAPPPEPLVEVCFIFFLVNFRL